MVEMLETANILHHADTKSLVLLDEIGRGTSTYDGLALARAAAEHLAGRLQAFTLFATHYFELTSLEIEIAGTANIHLAAVEHEGDIVFLHSVEPGPASQSYGVQVARLAGVPSSVLANARLHLAELEQHGLPQHPQQQDLFGGPGARADVHSPEVQKALTLLERLQSIDADDLSARQALELVYALIADAANDR